MSDLQIYSDSFDFEKEFKNIFDILKGETVANPNDNEARWVVALENKCHLLLAFFEQNRAAPGSMIGIGKEPDVPNDTSKQTLRNYGISLRKNGLRTDFFFIMGEESLHNTNTNWLFVTGVKVSKLLNTRPFVETYKLEVVREKKGEIKSIGDMIKVPDHERPKYHDMYIDGFLDMDVATATALDKLAYWRGNR